jgi:NAD(P)H-dependent FMN reductase
MPVSNPTAQVRVAVIVGSARDGRLAPQVAQWFLDRLGQRADMVTDVVDVASASMPDSLAATDPAVVSLRGRLAAADAFVVVAPEYNRSIPGPLKTLIDCYNAEWQAKPVAFVSYGLSLSGGVRAVEHLRQIFGEFHCVGMKDSVLFPRIMQHFDGEGTFAPEPASDSAVKLMLDQLAWWACALRDARTLRPYGG